ncbi:MAG: thiamine/thiamine pyrophosphate ABC transporter permease ThiP [Paracoccaceae bacterium]
MADNIKPIIPVWPGFSAAAVVAALTLGTLGAVAFRAESWAGLGPSDWSAIRFTVFQALLSASISVGLAIPVARALARRRFAGRGILITLLGAPFILPVIVAIFGLLAVFGRNGLVSIALGWFGLGPVQIYGLHGVVLAHVFFNLPLATRLILQGWQSVPAEQFRLAASLGFGVADIGRVFERPMLRDVLPGAFMVIFVICTTSFAVALALGGGPRATTVELAIYQAFRFDFDLGHAALLALVQFAICAVAAGVMLWVRVPHASGIGLDRVVQRWDARSAQQVIIDIFVIAFVATFLLVPLGMIVLRGVAGISDLSPAVFASAIRSVFVALASAVLTMMLVLPISFGVLALKARRAVAGALESVGYLAIAASPLVIGTGLFIMLFPFVNPVAIALPITALINALMSLPFVLRIIVPATTQIEMQFGGLADSLGLLGWQRLRRLHLPRLRRPIGFSMGLAAALSMGDLGVIALFADPQRATLPLQLYRLMASYRMDEAAAAALLLLTLSLILFWVFDRGGHVDADA